MIILCRPPMAIGLVMVSRLRKCILIPIRLHCRQQCERGVIPQSRGHRNVRRGAVRTGCGGDINRSTGKTVDSESLVSSASTLFLLRISRKHIDSSGYMGVHICVPPFRLLPYIFLLGNKGMSGINIHPDRVLLRHRLMRCVSTRNAAASGYYTGVQEIYLSQRDKVTDVECHRRYGYMMMYCRRKYQDDIFTGSGRKNTSALNT